MGGGVASPGASFGPGGWVFSRSEPRGDRPDEGASCRGGRGGHREVAGAALQSRRGGGARTAEGGHPPAGPGRHRASGSRGPGSGVRISPVPICLVHEHEPFGAWTPLPQRGAWSERSGVRISPVPICLGYEHETFGAWTPLPQGTGGRCRSTSACGPSTGLSRHPDPCLLASDPRRAARIVLFLFLRVGGWGCGVPWCFVRAGGVGVLPKRAAGGPPRRRSFMPGRPRWTS